MDLYLCEPVPPFPIAVSAPFNTFTTKQNVSSLGTVPCIPANKLRQGSKILLSARGNAGCTVTPTLSLGFWHGTRALAMSGDIAISSLITMASGVTAVPWIMEWEGLVTAVGTTGSMIGQGRLFLGSSVTVFNAAVPIPISAALRTVTIDTTIERAIGVSAAFSASNAANQVQVDDLRALILN